MRRLTVKLSGLEASQRHALHWTSSRSLSINRICYEEVTTKTNSAFSFLFASPCTHCMTPFRHWFGANAGTEHQKHARHSANSLKCRWGESSRCPPPGCGPASRSLLKQAPSLSSSGHLSPSSTVLAHSAPIGLSPDASCITQYLPRNATGIHR